MTVVKINSCKGFIVSLTLSFAGNWRVLHQLQTQLHMLTDFMKQYQKYIKTQQFPLYGLLSFLVSSKHIWSAFLSTFLTE